MTASDTGHRRYDVYDLPADVWITEDARQALFVAKVGDDCRTQHPQSQWHEYYDTIPTNFEAEYRAYPVIGYITE